MKLTTTVAAFFTGRLAQLPEVQRALESLREFARQFVPSIASGQFAATGAAQEVSGLPFETTHLLIILNATTSEVTIQTRTFGAAKAVEVAAAAVNTAANGITLDSGLDEDDNIVAKPGSFVAGSAIGANADVLHYVAIGI